MWSDIMGLIALPVVSNVVRHHGFNCAPSIVSNVVRHHGFNCAPSRPPIVSNVVRHHGFNCAPSSKQCGQISSFNDVASNLQSQMR